MIQLQRAFDPYDIQTYDASNLEKFIVTFENDFKACRKELEGFSLSLDQRATEKSPAELYMKMYQAREYTNRASSIYNKFLKMKILATKLHSNKAEERRVALQKEFRDHYDEIKAMRSTADRETYCAAFLPVEFEMAYVKSKILLETANNFLEYFKAQYFFWKDFQANLLTQLGTIKTMIQLGQLTGNVFNDMSQDPQIDRMVNQAIEGKVSFQN